ncbi:MAG: M24 family metallopeptidase, partial [Burkholderiales bacterium]
AELGGLLLFDQIAIRYATDSTNMQVWCGHSEVRACLLVAGGPLVLYDYARHPHLIAGLEGIDDYRVLPPLHFMFSGAESAAAARALASEIDSLLREYAGANRRLAVDRCSPTLGQALGETGLEILDAAPVTERARAIKSPGEAMLVRAAVAACDTACGAMKAALEPGITEAQLWAKLHEANIALGGEWIETRLLTSGPRTNPWFRECSQRVVEQGDLVCFDTDLIGPYGYCADISRSWLCGDGKPSDAQRRLYAAAFEQLQHNLALVKPGESFREISARSWPIPARYAERRYGVMLHGVGLADEWPSVYFAPDAAKNMDGVVEPGMVLSVESYLGEVG